MIVSAPASTANLGPGFDALGLALDVNMLVEVGASTMAAANDGHPAMVGFRRAGGTGPLGWSSKIPPGKGMGFSGASYVAGVAAAFVQQGRDLDEARDDVFALSNELEGHPDNAAPSTYGGLTVATSDRCIKVPIAADLRVVMWIPNYETSTNASRAALPEHVSHADATYNIGRTALLVAALATGELDALAWCRGDRMHEPYRLPALPQTAAAIHTAAEAGALTAFLSGSGPCAAAIVRPEDADRIAAELPTDNAHVKVLRVAEGVHIVG